MGTQSGGFIRGMGMDKTQQRIEAFALLVAFCCGHIYGSVIINVI